MDVAIASMKHISSILGSSSQIGGMSGRYGGGGWFWQMNCIIGTINRYGWCSER